MHWYATYYTCLDDVLYKGYILLSWIRLFYFLLMCTCMISRKSKRCLLQVHLSLSVLVLYLDCKAE